MDKELYINSYCCINSHFVKKNREEIVINNNSHAPEIFLKEIYRKLQIKYPKFFKMDSLSKLAFIASELLLSDFNDTNKIAIVFSNSASSLDTDRKFQESINNNQNYYPSPAVFVYTLPNIGIGEISIRNKLHSENAFFIFENYNVRFHHNYENLLIQNNKAEAVLAGWVNFDGKNVEAFIYLVSKNGTIKHNTKNLIKLYKE